MNGLFPNNVFDQGMNDNTWIFPPFVKGGWGDFKGVTANSDLQRERGEKEKPRDDYSSSKGIEVLRFSANEVIGEIDEHEKPRNLYLSELWTPDAEMAGSLS